MNEPTLFTTDQFLEFYQGRTDVVGIREGDAWRCLRSQNGQLQSVIDGHVAGRAQAAIYPLRDDGTVSFAVVDVDAHGAEDEDLIAVCHVLAFRIADKLRAENLHSYVSLSKSGGGNHHIDMFFSAPVYADRVRHVLSAIVDTEIARLVSEGKKTPDIELIPKQDRLQGGSIGSSISLPHFPPCARKGTTVFIDRDWNTYSPLIEKNPPAMLDALFERTAPKLKPAPQTIPLLIPVPIGGRHNQLTKIVGHFKGKRIPHEETLAIVNLWNSQLTEPLPEREIQQTVDSLYKGQSEGGVISFNLFKGGNMSMMPVSEAPDLLKDLLRSQSLGFLAGEEGAGKSLLGMNFGIAVATSAPNFLTWKIEHPGPVVFLNNEIYFEDVVRRFQAMTKTVPGRGSLDNFICPKEVPPLSECFDILDRLCTDEKPVLVLLDCLYFAHNEDENDSSRMKDLMRQLQALRDKHSTCVLVVHHLKKGGRDQRLNSELMRGAGVFGAAADSILMLRRSQTEEAKRILKATKLRHSSDSNKTARLLSLDPETLWFSDNGPVDEGDHISTVPTAQDVIDLEEILEGGEMRFGDILKACKGYGYNSKTIQRQLDDLMKAGKITKTRYGHYANAKMDTCPTDVQPDE